MIYRHSYFWILLLVSSVSFSTNGCEDLLPVYQAPENVFASRMVVDSFTVQYYESQKYYPELKGPLIDYNRYNTAQFFIFDYIKNTYEETIETSADINGKIELWQEGKPENKATLTVTQSDLYSTELYNSSNRSLKIDPGKTLSIKKGWNYKMDDGRWVHQTTIEVASEGTAGFYILYYYKPTLFHARSSIAFNKSMPAIVSDTTFILSLIGRYQINP